MKKRALILSLIIASIIFLSIGTIDAGGCDVRLRTECQSSPWNHIVMGVSSNGNAHGELASQGNYDYVLCCDFGTGDTTCDGTNKILGLSSATNAHAEVPDVGLPVYTNYDVCYEDLECISSGCSGDYDIPLVSLSGSTNAHLANYSGAGSYSEEICCKRGCKQFINQTDCWDFPTQNCTWTPPHTTNTSQGGGCCPEGEKWNDNQQICELASASVCNTIWSPLSQIAGVSVWNIFPDTFTAPPWAQYCAKVMNNEEFGYVVSVRIYDKDGYVN